jgi:anaerobic ribonucleoside-triphosphate reductase activating protein
VPAACDALTDVDDQRSPADTRATAASLRVGGLTAMSATDYPGALAAVVFCQGCGWRCGYCQNAHLRPRRAASMLSWSAVLTLLERRRGLLDAVVFSGGEPTLQPALPAAIRAAKALGFRVGLHTGGPDPARLRALLPWLDWVGFDIKAPFADYARITGTPGSGARALASAQALLGSGVPHEFRTTVHPALLSAEALTTLADGLASLGARRYVVQEFRSLGCADQPFATRADCAAEAPAGYPETLWTALRPRFAEFLIRRA